MARKNIKNNITHISGTFILYLILSIYTVIAIFPLIWLAITSLKTNSEVFLNPWALPKVLQLNNYLEAWNLGKMNIYLKNSTLLEIVCLFFSLLISCMAAYAISKFKTKISKFANVYFVFGILVPVHSMIIPLFMIMSKLKLLDNLISLVIVYTTFVLPISIFLLSSFMAKIPSELEEAGIVEGCNFLDIFYHIILPMSRPAIATVAILNFLSVWNEYIFALIFTGRDELRTLPVGLASFVGKYGTNYSTMAAGVIIAAVPGILIYLTMQENVIKGMTAGAVKG
ncbi:MAG: carbohydrate ABC transporter permease [Ruminiclostridium sp.]